MVNIHKFAALMVFLLLSLANAQPSVAQETAYEVTPDDDLQALVDQTEGQVRLMLSEGNYDQRLLVSHKTVTIIGRDPERTVLAASNDQSILRVKEADLFVQGVTFAPRTKDGFALFALDHANVHITDCRASGGMQALIYLRNAKRLEMSDCTLSDFGSAAIKSDTSDGQAQSSKSTIICLTNVHFTQSTAPVAVSITAGDLEATNISFDHLTGSAIELFNTGAIIKEARFTHVRGTALSASSLNSHGPVLLKDAYFVETPANPDKPLIQADSRAHITLDRCFGTDDHITEQTSAGGTITITNCPLALQEAPALH